MANAIDKAPQQLFVSSSIPALLTATYTAYKNLLLTNNVEKVTRWHDKIPAK